MTSTQPPLLLSCSDILHICTKQRSQHFGSLLSTSKLGAWISSLVVVQGELKIRPPGTSERIISKLRQYEEEYKFKNYYEEIIDK